MSNENSGKLMIKLGKFIKGEGNEKVQSPLVRVVIDGNTNSFNALSIADVVDKVNEKLGVEQGEFDQKQFTLVCAHLIDGQGEVIEDGLKAGDGQSVGQGRHGRFPYWFRMVSSAACRRLGSRVIQRA